MKALDMSFETLGLWIVTFSDTFIKSINHSSIKPCLIVHLVAVLCGLLCYALITIIDMSTEIFSRQTCQLIEWSVKSKYEMANHN